MSDEPFLRPGGYIAYEDCSVCGGLGYIYTNVDHVFARIVEDQLVWSDQCTKCYTRNLKAEQNHADSNQEETNPQGT